MPAFLVALLLLVLIVFGISSSAQSYATAQQAQAQIEVARVAQINAWGNLVIIFSFLVIVVVILALMVALVYLRSKVSIAKKTAARQPSDETALPSRQSLEALLYLKMFQALDAMQRPQQGQALELPADTPDDPFPWVK